METLLNSEQLASRLGVKPRTVQQWQQDGLIPAIRLTPKVIRYDLHEVVASLQERQTAKGGHDVK
jgi:predicted site-specific integrase-resolvase